MSLIKKKTRSLIAIFIVATLIITIFNIMPQKTFATTNTFDTDDITIGITYSNKGKRYMTSVTKAGAKAYMLPLVTNKEEARKELAKIDALIISGGSDVDPSHYNSEDFTEEDYGSPERDLSDMIMFNVAKELDMPVLGICRGMQVMNVAQGGTLYQDINSEYPDVREDVVHRDPNMTYYVKHAVNIVSDSKLYGIIKSTLLNNARSFHHQAIKTLGNNLTVTARAEDGIVEAIEFNNQTFMIGVQFHPEVAVVFDNDTQQLAFFEELKEQGRKYRQRMFETLTSPSIAVSTLASFDKVKVCWDTVDNANGYTVYYKRNSSNTYNLLGRTTKNYIQSGNLFDGIKYDFKIVPYIMRDGNYYNIDSYKTTSIYTMKKLNTPKITKYGDSYLTLAWNDIAGQDGYQVSRSTSSNTTYIVSTWKSYSNSFRNVNYGKTIGRSYYYKVRSFKSVAGIKIYGPWSNCVVYSRQLSAPKTVTASLKGSTQIKVTWKKVDNASGYAIYYKKGSTGSYSL